MTIGSREESEVVGFFVFLQLLLSYFLKHVHYYPFQYVFIEINRKILKMSRVGEVPGTIIFTVFYFLFSLGMQTNNILIRVGSDTFLAGYRISGYLFMPDIRKGNRFG